MHTSCVYIVRMLQSITPETVEFDPPKKIKNKNQGLVETSGAKRGL